MDAVPAHVMDYESIKALAKASGRSYRDLLAMAPHTDPFYAGAPAGRVLGEWFAAMWERCGYAGRRGIHLRRMHYHVSQNLPEDQRHLPDGTAYENDKESWECLADASRFARHLGLVDGDALDDRRNPDPKFLGGQVDLYRDTVPGYRIEAPDDWPEWWLPEIDTDPGWNLDFKLPEPEVGGYDYSIADQPYLLEVVVEKSTMDDVLEPVCRRYGVNLVSGPGFQSITYARKLLHRVRQSGKPARIFYISDFDPAGERMPVAVARQIEFYLPQIAPGADVKLTQVALTPEQVDEYGLPRIPNNKRDVRMAKFEKIFGEGRVELDALEGVRPGELARLLAEAAAPYVDETLSRALGDAKREAQAAVDAAWDDATAPYRPELKVIADEAMAITARYRERLAALNAELQEELAPLQVRLTAARRALTTEVHLIEVEVPARPEPETDAQDEDAWLFDAGRDYLAQIAAYKDRRGENLGEVVIPTDGLTDRLRETVETIRAAGGRMTTAEFAASTGMNTVRPQGAAARLKDCEAAGLLTHTGRGGKGNPQVWQVVEGPQVMEETA